MAKRSHIEQLDDAVEAAMAKPDAPLTRVGPRLAGVLRIAAELRGLPGKEFKERLGAELAAKARVMRASRPAKEPSAAASRAVRTRKVRPVPEGYHTATPCLVIRDAPAAIEFYQRAFGATELMRQADPSGHIVHAEIMIGDSRIAIAGEEADYNLSPQALGGSSVITQLYVEDVDSFAERAIAAGAKVVFPIADQFYGERGGRLQDPFGHLWIVATHTEDVSPAEMGRRMEAYAKAQGAVPKKLKPAVGPIREGFHSITPMFVAAELDRQVDFMREAFGAKELLRGSGGDHRHVELRIGDSMVELGDPTGVFQPNPTAMWLFVDDADVVYERALKAGATSLHKPIDQPYGDREASVKDLSGNHWYIATHREDAQPLPDGLRNVAPYLHPIGAPKVIDFLKRAFDAEEIERAQDDEGTVHHAKVRIGDSVIAMGEAHGPYQPMPPALHLYVGDVDAVYKRALKAGARSLYAPTDKFYGDREAGVRDPFGDTWVIATHKGDFVQEQKPQQARQESPRAGAIMPFMYMDDAAAAAEFYKKVFDATEVHREVQRGRVSHVQLAIGDTRVMLRDATTPDLKEYVEKGFARTPTQLGGTPLHLYVYVADADAAFKRAIDLGSEVTDPMEDKEWGDRCGGVRDPFGHIWYIATPIAGGASKN